MQEQQRRYGEAAKAYRSILQADGDTGLLFELALAAKKHKQYEHAKSSYQWILEQAEDHYPAMINLGILEKKSGNLIKAESLFLAALTLVPRNINARYNLALLYRDQQRLDVSARLLLEVVNQDAEHQKAWLALDKVRQQQKLIAAADPADSG